MDFNWDTDSKDQTFQFWSSVCKWKKMELPYAEKSLINIFLNEVNLQRNSSNALQQNST